MPDLDQSWDPGPLTEDEIGALRRGIGERLRRVRRERTPPWSQLDLALAAGCRADTISRIERGLLDFRVSQVIRLAQALGVGPEELLPGSGELRQTR